MDDRKAPSCSLVLALLVAVGAFGPTARAQTAEAAPQAQVADEQAPSPAAETRPELGGEQAPAAPVQAEAPVEAVPAARARQRREHDLRLELGRVQREWADTSALSAWLFTAVGVGVLVSGLAVGAADALGCKRSCSTSFWPGWMVVGGATMTTAGIVWIKHKQGDIAELESRRFHLEQELQRVGWSMAVNAKERAPLATFTWRGSF